MCPPTPQPPALWPPSCPCPPPQLYLFAVSHFCPRTFHEQSPLPGKSSPSSRLLDLGTINIWGQISLCCKGCPMHHRMFSSTPGLYPLGARSTPRCCQVPLGAPLPQAESHRSRSSAWPRLSFPSDTVSVHVSVLTPQ